MYATDTRIGRGIMPPRIGCRLSLLRYHAAGEGASLFPVGQERRFAVSCRGPPEKALRCFPLTGLYELASRKTSHRGFSGLYESVVSWELFLLQKVPQAARQFVLRLFPSKGA